jgi:hypothetical protein
MGYAGLSAIKAAISITNLHVFAMWAMIPLITTDTDSSPLACWKIIKMKPSTSQM